MHDIVEIAHIKKYITEKRNSGFRKIVFTNGCFDILHTGHVDLLEKAKALGDFLILGLNSDDSVRRLKGNDRPLVPETDRAFILSRLESVDAVCIFSQDTPLKLIELIRPDFLVKGGDYALNEIIGYDRVTGYGGKVLTVPLIKGRSTSIILDKIKATTKQEGLS